MSKSTGLKDESLFYSHNSPTVLLCILIQNNHGYVHNGILQSARKYESISLPVCQDTPSMVLLHMKC